MDTWGEPRSDSMADIQRVKEEVERSFPTFEERRAGALPSLERHLEDMQWQRWARDPSPFPAKSERWEDADPAADWQAYQEYVESGGPERELEKAVAAQKRYAEGFDHGYEHGASCDYSCGPSIYEDPIFHAGRATGKVFWHLSGGK